MCEDEGKYFQGFDKETLMEIFPGIWKRNLKRRDHWKWNSEDRTELGWEVAV
jgi:hypothetical protein